MKKNQITQIPKVIQMIQMTEKFADFIIRKKDVSAETHAGTYILIIMHKILMIQMIKMTKKSADFITSQTDVIAEIDADFNMFSSPEEKGDRISMKLLIQIGSLMRLDSSMSN